MLSFFIYFQGEKQQLATRLAASEQLEEFGIT